MERGKRHPDRDDLVPIVVYGLAISDIGEIDRILQIAGYEALNEAEVSKLGLTRSAAAARAPALVEASRFRTDWSAIFGSPSWDWLSTGIVFGSLVVACLIAVLVSGRSLFVLLTSCLYAALFVTSVYLERAFEPDLVRLKGSVPLCFGFVAVTSTAALAIDHILVDSGSPFGLLLSMTIFLLSAVLQFFIVRLALSERAIVEATFQTRTAQAAHLKNTGYFLLIVVVFWLPSFHCVSTLAREVRARHVVWVHQTIENDLMLGRGILALSVRSLLILLLATLFTSLYMGYHLLDNLRPHPRLNAYTILFYLRALLYFSLCLICIGWYAYALSEMAV